MAKDSAAGGSSVDPAQAAAIAPTSGRGFLATDYQLVDGVVHATGRWLRNRAPTGPEVTLLWPLHSVRRVQLLESVEEYR